MATARRARASSPASRGTRAARSFGRPSPWAARRPTRALLREGSRGSWRRGRATPTPCCSATAATFAMRCVARWAWGPSPRGSTAWPRPCGGRRSSRSSAHRRRRLKGSSPRSPSMSTTPRRTRRRSRRARPTTASARRRTTPSTRTRPTGGRRAGPSTWGPSRWGGAGRRRRRRPRNWDGATRRPIDQRCVIQTARRRATA
mmetsp:Transcript_19954/g.61577  ORF Transcript_19954/g.61577 Transcript_19954/m.61577 type:complete len:202 (-) Transcript_19954:175-780(-)